MVDDTAKAHGRSTGTAGISRTDERDVFHSILQQDMPDDEDYDSDIRHPECCHRTLLPRHVYLV